MNHERAMLLVAALRSGRYQQGLEQLRVDDKFCCLGVACDISGIGTWDKGDYEVGRSSDDLTLPAAVMEWFEFQTEIGRFNNGDEMLSLSALNDSGRTFAEIADLIEARWAEL